MKRPIVYSGQVPLTKDLLEDAQYGQIADASLLEAVRGAQTPGVYGLGIKQTASPSLQVDMERGVLAAPMALEPTAYSALAADSTTYLKYGVSTGRTIAASVSLPSGSNKQICIVQVELQENDIDNVVLPYYNAADPTQALLGPGGGGSTQPRNRVLAIAPSFKYGTPTTGTPVAPTPDSGQIALCEFELKSTTTQITAAADSSTNAQIKAYSGGTPLLNNFAQLDAAQNTFIGHVSTGANFTSLGTAAAGTSASLADHLPRLAQFAFTDASSGRIVIPTTGDDIIIQWVSMTATGAGFGTAFTWPTAFPNDFWAAVATPHVASTGSPLPSAWLSACGTSGGTLHCNDTSACKIIAVGS